MFAAKPGKIIARLGIPPFYIAISSALQHKVRALYSLPAQAQSVQKATTAFMADAPRVVGVLSALLERVVDRNDSAADELPASSLALASAFRATTRPDISVRAYMARIARFAGCSPACYVVAYVYLDRLLRRGHALAVDSYTVHRLLITAVLAAVKFMDDV
jgi:hypothetical protein